MVEDRITDGKRIAQLLASELTGRQRGPLAAIEVVDADRDAEPSPDGTTAFVIASAGERIGTVEMFDSRAVLAVTVENEAIEAAAKAHGLTTERTEHSIAVVVDHGAAVKRATDALSDALRSIESGDDVG